MYLLRTSFSVTTLKMKSEFGWEGNIISAYFWGFIVPQVPAGILAMRFGGRWVLGLGFALPALFLCFVPLAAKHIGLLLFLQVCSGFCNACIFPAATAMLGKWAPPKERTILAAIVYAGSGLGIALGQPIAGVICDSVLGWRSVYYIYCSVTIFVFLVYIRYIYSSPETDPRVSIKEKEFIRGALAKSAAAIRSRKESIGTSTQTIEMTSEKQQQTSATSKKEVKISVFDQLDETDKNETGKGKSKLLREYSQIVESPREYESMLKRENTFPISHSESNQKNLVDEKKSLFNKQSTKDEDVFVEPSIATTSFIISNIVTIHHEKSLTLGKQGPPSFKEIPWLGLVTNLGCLSIYCSHFCTSWGLYTLMAYFPAYVKDIFEVSVGTASLMILFPYLFYFLVQILISPVGDWLIKKGVKVITIRKSYIFFGNIFTAIFLIIAGYCKTMGLAVFFMTLSVGCSSIAPAGFNANMLDVTTRFSGVVMGFSNMFATIPGIITPFIVTAVVGDNPTAEAWREIFIIAACVISFSSFFYVIFARATVQKSLSK